MFQCGIWWINQFDCYTLDLLQILPPDSTAKNESAWCCLSWTDGNGCLIWVLACLDVILLSMCSKKPLHGSIFQMSNFQLPQLFGPDCLCWFVVKDYLQLHVVHQWHHPRNQGCQQADWRQGFQWFLCQGCVPRSLWQDSIFASPYTQWCFAIERCI